LTASGAGAVGQLSPAGRLPVDAAGTRRRQRVRRRRRSVG